MAQQASPIQRWIKTTSAQVRPAVPTWVVVLGVAVAALAAIVLSNLPATPFAQ